VIPWLNHWHSLLWYRSGFNPAIKCDYITNNIAEVFNNWIKDHKDLVVCELAEKIRVMVMELFFRRGRIGQQLNGKILPSILNVLQARTRSLGHLSLTKGDHYCAEVQDTNNVFTKHIVKADEMYWSCEEWQHAGKPCQHGLLVILAQPFRDVGMKHIVDEYFSVEKFKKAYARKIDPFVTGDFGPKWTLLHMWVHRLAKCLLATRERIGSRVAWRLLVVERNLLTKRLRKQENCFVARYNVQTVVKWAIEKTVLSVASMVQKRGKYFPLFFCIFHIKKIISHFLYFVCRKWKARKNTTKG
jgi:hypothetical protein